MRTVLRADCEGVETKPIEKPSLTNCKICEKRIESFAKSEGTEQCYDKNFCYYDYENDIQKTEKFVIKGCADWVFRIELCRCNHIKNRQEMEDLYGDLETRCHLGPLKKGKYDQKNFFRRGG